MATASNGSPPYFTTPSYQNVIRATTLRANERSNDCPICLEHLGNAPAAAPSLGRRVTLSTNCPCDRPNQVFHEYCLANEALRQQSMDLRTPLSSMFCPLARHSVGLGDLQVIVESFFPSREPSLSSPSPSDSEDSLGESFDLPKSEDKCSEMDKDIALLDPTFFQENILESEEAEQASPSSSEDVFYSL